MKKNISFVFVIMFLFTAACSHNIEEMYTAPTVKNQPRLIYPKTAQENSITGKARVLVSVSNTGAVEKINLTESAGNKELDEAAIEFCKRLEFIPATLDGQTIPSKISMAINFDISESNWDSRYYVREIKNLFADAADFEKAERMKILKQILAKHEEFVSQMKDGLNFNRYMEQVISPELVHEWKKDWNSWPLSFLLYHDFIKRFPDYEDLTTVREQLAKAVREDIRYINSITVADSITKSEKEKIITKITVFLRINYPDIDQEKFIMEPVISRADVL